MKIYKFPNSLTELRDKFLNYYTKELSRSSDRARHIKYTVNDLYRFMELINLKEISGLLKRNIIQYQDHLYKVNRLSGRGVLRHMHDLNLYSRYLFNNNLIWKNPFAEIEYISPPEIEETKITRRYSFQETLTMWVNWMKKEEYYIQGIKMRHKSAEIFISFLKQRGIKSIYKVTPEIIDEYKKYLTEYQYEHGKTYNPFTQVCNLRYACSFLTYLDRRKLIKTDPSKHIIFRRYCKELQQKYIKEKSIISRKQNPAIPDPVIQELLDKFLQYARSRGNSEDHMSNNVRAVEKFYNYINAGGITDLRKITRSDIMDYQSWLSSQLTIKGTKYSSNTLQNLIICLRGFFRYLFKYEYLQSDPTSSVDIPKGEQGIPHSCMTEREIKILLNKPNTLDYTGIRDKAIMEVLYSTAIRATELTKLQIEDIDFAQGLLRVDYPKGGKSYQRIIPIGKTACEYVKLYLEKTRPLLDKANNRGYLFLSVLGNPLCKNNVNTIIKKYVSLCGLKKRISTHSFRVSCATHMLTYGADIRYVQQQLGHKSIKTTQGYTRLVPKDLKAVHMRTHPREKVVESAV